MAVVTVGLLLQLVAQHHVSSTQFVLCLAPDCQSSSYQVTETCGGLPYLAEAPFVALTLAVALVAQLVLAVRGRHATSRARVGMVIATILAAQATGLGVLFHRVFQHLFDSLALGLGDVGTGLVVLSLLAIGPLELLKRKPAPA